MRPQAYLSLALFYAFPLAFCETGDVWEVALSHPHDPSGEGFIHLGDDGVLRSFSGSGDVISYEQLSPEQISQYITPFPASEKEHLLELYDGVDGRSVTETEQLIHPSSDLLPPMAEISEFNTSVLNRLSKRACFDYACSSDTLCLAYSCTLCAKADAAYWGYCV